MQPETPAWLWDAKQATDAIGQFIDGIDEEEFVDSLLVRSAVERQLEILGEALKRIRRSDADTAHSLPHIHRIIGMRNVISHEYGDIDYEIVWTAVTVHMQELGLTIERLLRDS